MSLQRQAQDCCCCWVGSDLVLRSDSHSELLDFPASHRFTKENYTKYGPSHLCHLLAEKCLHVNEFCTKTPALYNLYVTLTNNARVLAMNTKLALGVGCDLVGSDLAPLVLLATSKLSSNCQVSPYSLF